MVAAAVDWTSVENALHAWVVGATDLSADRVVWSPTNAPQVPRTWGWLSIISGPTREAWHEPRWLVQRMLEQFTVNTAAPGSYALRVYSDDPADTAGTLRSFAAGGLDTVTTIRNGLLAALAPESGLTLASVSTNALTVEGSTSRPRFHIAVESGDMTRTTLRDGGSEVVSTPSVFTIRVQFEADGDASDRTVRDLSARCAASLGMSSFRNALRNDGRIALRSVEATSLITRNVGARYISRASQDFRFAVALTVSSDLPWARTSSVAQATP